jgi:D-alanine--poly(phosphoribitol) ligase subunit 1
MDLLDRIDAWGDRVPDRIAHRVNDTTLTWAELVRRSDALSCELAGLGLDAGSPIVVRGHKESEMLIGFLGCAKAGHPYVPVDTGVPDARVERIVAASGARLVLTPDSVRDLVSRGIRRGVARPRVPATADTPHYIMFTSGSTGEPKGAVITRGCLEAFLGWMVSEHRFADGEVFLNQAVFSFDLSVMDTWTCLATGGTLSSLTAADLGDFRRLFESLEASGITTWVSTPQVAHLCLAERRFDAALLPDLRRFLFCGDVLTPEVASKLLERFPAAEVWNTYGPTEATVATTSLRVTRDVIARYPQIPVGVAMPGTVVQVEDEEGRVAADGTRGELVIIGPNVSPGYLGRPDLTQRAFTTRDGVRVYRTGDWGTRENGLLFFHGRMDGQVKIAGHRIELGDVETHLASLSSVSGAVVLVSYKAGSPSSLHAFVVLGQRPAGSDLEIGAALRKELARLVPAYMLPRRFHVLDHFPLTANGKRDRKALAALLGA